jgi:hypothetical protein
MTRMGNKMMLGACLRGGNMITTGVLVTNSTPLGRRCEAIKISLKEGMEI